MCVVDASIRMPIWRARMYGRSRVLVACEGIVQNTLLLRFVLSVVSIYLWIHYFLGDHKNVLVNHYMYTDSTIHCIV